jgi:cytochrome c-type biogenesis protein CcmH
MFQAECPRLRRRRPRLPQFPGRLANRLKQDPKDADGWMRLMRAKMVLGETGAAREAHRSGLAAFQGDPAAQAKLNRAAEELGVPRG